MAWTTSGSGSLTPNISGGTAGTAAYGQWDRITFSGTWTVGKFWTIPITSNVGDFTVGASFLSQNPTQTGFVTFTPNALLTLADRVYIANGTQLNFSAVGNAAWYSETVGTATTLGAGTIGFLTGYGVQDTLNGLVSFQGRIGLIFRYRVELWNYDADPANFSRAQLLINIGTAAGLSVAALGDMDALFLDDSGVRSLRALVTTLNASMVGIGSPIDQTIIDAINGGATASTACAIVEPQQKQYWLCLNGVVYVLSYYPQVDTTAWSTFVCNIEALTSLVLGAYNGAGSYTLSGLTVGATYKYNTAGNETSVTLVQGDYSTVLSVGDTFSITDSTDTVVFTGPISTGVTTVVKIYDHATGFSPVKFIVYLGIVYAFGSDYKLYRYGGSDNNTYDYCQPTMATPWLDGKDGASRKAFTAVDLAKSGKWLIQFGNDPISGTLSRVDVEGSATSPSGNVDSTFDSLIVPFEGVGTHFKFKAIGLSNKKSKISQVIAHYNQVDRT